MPYVVNGGFGVYAYNNPKRIAATVYNFFDDEKLLRRMSERAKKLSRPQATREIARDIGAVVLRSTFEMPKLKDTL